MSKRPASLYAHKNTVERHRKKEIQREVGSFGKFLKDRDVRAYAVVAIDSNGGSHCLWDTGSIIPMWSFAATMMECLRRDIEDNGGEETWKPPLPIKG